ncbi:hypothetical protein GWK47_047618 [Chionoecetes opilio]|uniref:Uncharacterized protein n=1 Tax=Chionoecetes opilio TaxID=41210 RepID=A0A8J4YGC8_CHIOP|nr:hypothetical protein GWK47_047618 [Chionoecetes opilio]
MPPPSEKFHFGNTLELTLPALTEMNYRTVLYAYYFTSVRFQRALSLARMTQCIRPPNSCLCGDTPRYSSLRPVGSPFSREIIQTASAQEGGEGCAGVAFTPYLHRLTYTFLLDLAPGDFFSGELSEAPPVTATV